jgi:hypothetical protein
LAGNGRGIEVARVRRKRKQQTARIEIIDATPERIAKADSEFVNPAEIDSSEQAIGYVRRIKADTRLDKWYRAKIISQIQFDAGNWYRTVHHASCVEPRVVAAYGERTTNGSINYGLPANNRQMTARLALREARSVFPREMVGFMDRFLLRDALPNYRGRQQMRTIAQARQALSDLASYLRMG